MSSIARIALIVFGVAVCWFRAIRLLPSGEFDYLKGSSVVADSRIDPNDASGRTMRANLQPNLHRGLYWVSWNTTTDGWRSVTLWQDCFRRGHAGAG
jgi:hypothetical protein